jgi:Zn-dependent alcohol dehydrogenase
VGATHTINVRTADDVVDSVRQLTSGHGVDVALEFVGLPESTQQAIAITRRGGQVVFTGLAAPGTTIQMAEFLGNGKVLKGNLMGMGRFADDFPKLVKLYQDGELLLDEMVSRTIGQDEVVDAFRAMEAGEVARSVIDMS